MNEYPDVRIDQLVNVLLTRGDVSKGEARQVSYASTSSLGRVHTSNNVACYTVDATMSHKFLVLSIKSTQVEHLEFV